jgi:CRP-like cAMP-binding protein
MASTQQMLRSVPLFEGLTTRELREVIRAGKEVEFPPGSPIVERGLQAEDFYLIISGEAELSVPGRKRSTLGPGAHFGEISVLDGGPRSATIRARTRVWALRLDREAFLDVMERHGSIGLKVLRETTRRLRAAERSSTLY